MTYGGKEFQRQGAAAAKDLSPHYLVVLNSTSFMSVDDRRPTLPETKCWIWHDKYCGAKPDKDLQVSKRIL